LKVCEALRRLQQVVGKEIDFHCGDAHARVAGVQRRKHEMEKPDRGLADAAPGIQILVNQADRLIGALDGKFEKTLGPAAEELSG